MNYQGFGDTIVLFREILATALGIRGTSGRQPMDSFGEWGRGYRCTSGRQPMDTIREWVGLQAH